MAILRVDDEHLTIEIETHGTLHTGPHLSASGMFKGIYEEMPPHLSRQRQQAGV